MQSSFVVVTVLLWQNAEVAAVVLLLIVGIMPVDGVITFSTIISLNFNQI